jgi:hypothetical protein
MSEHSLQPRNCKRAEHGGSEVEVLAATEQESDVSDS